MKKLEIDFEQFEFEFEKGRNSLFMKIIHSCSGIKSPAIFIGLNLSSYILLSIQNILCTNKKDISSRIKYLGSIYPFNRDGSCDFYLDLDMNHNEVIITTEKEFLKEQRKLKLGKLNESR